MPNLFFMFFVKFLINFVQSNWLSNHRSVFGEVQVAGTLESNAFGINVVHFKQQSSADPPVPFTQSPFSFFALVGERGYFVHRRTHQTNPVVRWLFRQGRDVTRQVIHLGAAVATVEGIPSVVTDCAPFLTFALVVSIEFRSRSFR